MTDYITAQTQTASEPTFTPKVSSLLHRAAIHSSPNQEVPPIVYDVLHSPGQSLDSQTRIFMESRFNHDMSQVKPSSSSRLTSTQLTIEDPHTRHEEEAEFTAAQVIHRSPLWPVAQLNDFSQVRIHTDTAAADATRSINARAVTLGQHIIFGSGEFQTGTTAGKRLLAHELTHVLQQSRSDVAIGSLQRQPLPDATAEISEVPAIEKTDEELALGIIETQAAILLGWHQALHRFDKVLTSASDKETKPNFKKVIKLFLQEKLMGELFKRSKIPGAGDAFALLGKLEVEMKRATAATESAALRDFVVQHGDAITKLHQKTLALKEDFIAKVRMTREKMELAGNTAMGNKKDKRKSGKITLADSPEANEYGQMRLMLVETLEKMDTLLKELTIENLYRMLSEEWIRQSTIRGGMGVRFPAKVIIRLNKDYTIRNAHIQGPGGQKIAEQLLKDSPNGVDVFSLKVRRNILVYADNGWPSAILSLDENNRNLNVGSIAEGNWYALERHVLSKGVQPTKVLTGD